MVSSATDVKGVPVVFSKENHLMCPIGSEIMADPVRINCSGSHVFERANIQDWFIRQGKDSCPCCHIQVKDKTLTPAGDYRQAIEAWHEAQKAITEVEKLKKENELLKARLAKSPDAKGKDISVADPNLQQHTRMIDVYNETIEQKQNILAALRFKHRLGIQKFLRKNLGATFDRKKDDKKDEANSKDGFQNRYNALRDKIREQIADHDGKVDSASMRLKANLDMAVAQKFQNNVVSLKSGSQILEELKQLNEVYQQQKEARKKEVDSFRVEAVAMKTELAYLFQATDKFKVKKAELLSEMSELRNQQLEEAKKLYKHSLSQFPMPTFFKGDSKADERKNSSEEYSKLNKEEKSFCEFVRSGDVRSAELLMHKCIFDDIPLNPNCVMVTPDEKAILPPFFEAIKREDLPIVNFILKWSAFDINQVGSFIPSAADQALPYILDRWVTPLAFAAKTCGSTRILEALMNHPKIELDRTSPELWWTAVHYGAYVLNTHAVACLIKKGASSKPCSKLNKTPIKLVEETYLGKGKDAQIDAMRQAIKQAIEERQEIHNQTIFNALGARK